MNSEKSDLKENLRLSAPFKTNLIIHYQSKTSEGEAVSKLLTGSVSAVMYTEYSNYMMQWKSCHNLLFLYL